MFYGVIRDKERQPILMSPEVIIALVFIVPIVVFFTAFVWYLNVGGAWSAVRKAGKRTRPAAGTSRLETEKA
jgi:hypothetical protein